MSFKIMNYKNILNEYFDIERTFHSRRKLLIVLLGCFADFDSFEYCQELSSQVKKLSKHSIDLIIIGIGNEKSKEFFCRFNEIDIQKVVAVRDSEIHKRLNLNSGLALPIPAILNLLIMCTGINSRGTIKEVLRGYWGDSKAKNIFQSDEEIKIGRLFKLKGEMFETFSKKDILRPFELATRRLLNMIEILSNWSIYTPNPSFLTQRGATILINEEDEVIYKFKSNSLLGYSKNMSTPLSFLDDFLL